MLLAPPAAPAHVPAFAARRRFGRWTRPAAVDMGAVDGVAESGCVEVALSSTTVPPYRTFKRAFHTCCFHDARARLQKMDLPMPACGCACCPNPACWRQHSRAAFSHSVSKPCCCTTFFLGWLRPTLRPGDAAAAAAAAPFAAQRGGNLNDALRRAICEGWDAAAAAAAAAAADCGDWPRGGGRSSAKAKSLHVHLHQRTTKACTASSSDRPVSYAMFMGTRARAGGRKGREGNATVRTRGVPTTSHPNETGPSGASLPARRSGSQPCLGSLKNRSVPCNII